MGGITAADKNRRLRGVALKLLCDNHDEQKSRLDDVSLWSALIRLAFDVSQNELITICQDLEGRGYVKFQTLKNKRTGDVELRQIELCPKGRDLLEGTIEDRAVEV